jgi:hypothetical protein
MKYENPPFQDLSEAWGGTKGFWTFTNDPPQKDVPVQKNGRVRRGRIYHERFGEHPAMHQI